MNINFSEFDITVLLGLMILGYLLANLPLFDKVNNKLIELILLLVGGVAYLLNFDFNMLKCFEGCVVGIMAAGSYTLLNNLSSFSRTYIENLAKKVLSNE